MSVDLPRPDSPGKISEGVESGVGSDARQETAEASSFWERNIREEYERGI